jgi:hypothetical protein
MQAMAQGMMMEGSWEAIITKAFVHCGYHTAK